MASKEELEKLTIPALKALCKERNITGVSKAKKEVLVARLLGGSSADAPTTAAPTATTAPKPKKPSKKAQKSKEVASVPAETSRAPDVEASSGPSEVSGEGVAQDDRPGPPVIPPPPVISTDKAAPPQELPAIAKSAIVACSSEAAATADSSSFSTLPQPPQAATAAPARDRKRAPPASATATSTANIKRVKLAPKAVPSTPAPSTATGPDDSAQQENVVPKAAPPSKPKASARKIQPKAVATGFKPLARTVKPDAPAKETAPAVTADTALTTRSDILADLSQSWLARASINILQQTGRAGSGATPANPLHLLFARTFLDDQTTSAEQLRIAIRFATARLHTSFQLGNHEDIIRPLVVIAVEPALDRHRYHTSATSAGEIELWEVTTEGKQAIMCGDLKGPRRISSSSSGVEMREVKVTYLIIGATGDVVATRREIKAKSGPGVGAGSGIGSRMLQSQGSMMPMSQGSMVLPVDPDASFAVRWQGGAQSGAEQQWRKGLRHDWTTYLTSEEQGAQLVDKVRTKEGEQYPSGIARAWKTRAEQAGLVAEWSVAERYVLSNAALNSVSGQYLSTAQMDAERIGQAVPDVRPKKPSVAFYLPESQHVESVSLSIFRGGKALPLHPAIAAVTRPASTDLVLRETGQIIGCEEGDGISELWQALLGCGPNGLPLEHVKAEQASRRFWQGYEEDV